MARKQSRQRFELVHPHCAGIDIGSREHWVAVDRDHEQPVRSFSTFTDDLIKLADWLEGLKIEVVAMEATGVYWIPLFGFLMREASRSIWSTHAQRGRFPVVNPMSSIASGYGN